jgi:hypothetical protein
MEICLARLDGIEGTRRIVERSGNRLRVLMPTTYVLDEYVLRGAARRRERRRTQGFSARGFDRRSQAVVAGGALFDPVLTRALTRSSCAALQRLRNQGRSSKS